MPRKKKLQEVGGLRLVAYYRYSNGGQQTEQSIEGQRRDCEAYAQAHGYKIVHEYIDRHISGKSDSRPAFQQMISDSDSHLFDAVICWKTDRLARSRYDSIIYKTRLRRNGVKILYAAETVVDGPEGIIIESMIAITPSINTGRFTDSGEKDTFPLSIRLKSSTSFNNSSK